MGFQSISSPANTDGLLSINVTDPAFAASRLEDVLMFTGFFGFLTSSVSLFLIPRQSYYKFWDTRPVGNHDATPHLIAFLSAMLWVLYGLQFVYTLRRILFIVCKLIDCCIAMVYLLLFSTHSKSWNQRRKVRAMLILEIMIVGIFAATVLSVAHDTKLRLQMLGVIAMMCHLGMYSTLVSAMKLGIVTGSVEHMNEPLAYVSFLNCGLWAAFAIFPFDLYLFVSSVLGLVLGLVQLVLISRYQMLQFQCREEQRNLELELP